MSIGRDFFTAKEGLTIRVLNMNGVTQNREVFEPLVGLTLPAKEVYQSWYERSGEGKIPVGGPIEGRVWYQFTAADVVSAMKEAGRDPGPWATHDQDLEALLPIQSCELV